MLEAEFDVSPTIYSVTSYKCIYEDGRDRERLNLMHNENKPSYIEETLNDDAKLTVSVCDYIKTVPLTIAPWVRAPYIAMGADGFGLSDHVPALRDHFELSAKFIVRTTITKLVQQGDLKESALKKLNELYTFDLNKPNPADFN